MNAYECNHVHLFIYFITIWYITLPRKIEGLHISERHHLLTFAAIPAIIAGPLLDHSRPADGGRDE